ncbi:AAA domain-containing protein [Fusobacterium russii]|uniref:AAA domain-containing protein n=1 Tax=Fusobacterium russii TaxID=854 RepID=UPI0003A69385|nr:AAA domain-containing protein [Fusobacterium russii]
MENKEKAISLFKYIMELYAQKYPVVTDINKQEWIKFISNIHGDKENINLNYMDRLNEEIVEESSDKIVLLEVKKPEFEKIPVLPKSLEDWVYDGWDDFKQELKRIEKKPEDIEETEENSKEFEKFEDKKSRVEAFKKFELERSEWQERQKIIEATRKLFNDLYLKYIDLERDSEVIELMIGQGILEAEMPNEKKVYHPILLKKVAMEFDALNNIIKIVDTDSEPEIYTMLLQGINFINHSVIKGLKEELLENFYHPLDRNETAKFLKTLVHSLDSKSKYVEDINEKIKTDDRLVIYNNPVFFIRKRTSGVVKAIEEIIGQIEETGKVAGPLLNLIGENVPQYNEMKEGQDISESLSNISGEDRKILLSKEANREQLEIARRIEDYNAVLVQGPPGTGKTHTIANLMGHFLAQGKNILVTSHTKKALSVVKEKLSPELQHLCVSVLDDNSKDMEKSIDGITEYISSHSRIELEKNIEELENKREEIIAELSNARKEIFSIKYKEFESITFENENFNPSQAAKFVYENRETLSYIPGKVSLGKAFPVSESDLILLYKTNELISVDEEQELGTSIPNPNLLISPEEFEVLAKDEAKVLDRNKEILNNLSDKNVKIDYVNKAIKIKEKNLCQKYEEEALKNLKTYLEETKIKDNKNDEWSIYAVLDGKKGGGFKAIWLSLAQKIEDTYKYSGENVINLIGKIIQGNIEKTNNNLQSLREMKEHLLKGKKINSFSLFKPKEWIKIYEEVRVNGNTIETVADCESVIAFLELAMKRDEISRLWYELIEKKGGLSFKSFGEEPEQHLMEYVSKIKNCVNWYDEIYPKVQNLIELASLDSQSIIENKKIPSSLDEINEIVKNIYFYLPSYLDILLNMNSKLANLTDKYEQSKASFTEEQIKISNLCKNLMNSLIERDTEKYREGYEKLLNLYSKNNYISERYRILSAIKNVAPEWADLIKNRIGIHGETEPPKNIIDAWKWKQFSAIIDEITAMPFEELQYTSLKLSKELRKTTGKLVENLAWLQLFNRIEEDITQKQALQGWKLTVKKIGKGTGKTAPALRKEAKKLMAKCQKAVPAWVMPVNKALESLDPKTNKFDIVIIDEASQSDISALAILYLAKKIIIVGDDEQVSPSAVGLDVDKMTNLSNMFIKGIIPNAHLYDMKSSLYDIAKTTFPSLMLREHFRCVPDIIGYSNRLSYEYKIKALRDDSSVPVKPATISYYLEDGVRNDKQKVNEKEAKSIVALMLACMDFEEYKDMSFGAISLLGDEQANKINLLATEKIKPIDFAKRKILCGNASHFQGDERDIIFISLVDNNEGESPLRITGEGIGKAMKQRYNVAASRAKNQLWIVHSLDITKDLKIGDMRKDLIEYVMNPSNFKEPALKKQIKIDSELETAIANHLIAEGYDVVQDWKVGSYRIDMVVKYENKKIAIECDGDLYNNGKEGIKADMERQAVLERLGWRFIRIRGSEYYSNPEETLKRVLRELSENDIKRKNSTENINKTKLLERLIERAKEILKSWEEEIKE